MLKSERHDAITNLVDERNTVTVSEIAARLSVSEMTVRRDLTELADLGKVVRVHGGARSVAGMRGITIPRELTHAEKRAVHAPEKAQIAKAALPYVDEGATIFLGPGTTVEALARLIPAMPLRIITNSLPVIELIQDREGIDLWVVGGGYRASTGAFVGPLAEQIVGMLGIDAAFIGLNGIYEQRVSTSNTPEGVLQQLVLDRADRRYLLADSSKLGRRDFFGFYDLDDVDALITDRLITDDQRHALGQHTTVITA
ncbi:MAG: DeoR/GlpR family DNA-binding transcription regulator [Acidobacteriota bacterium]|nr:DeoR/GlpR family DNA-binding transcription regulator [Acidobacteriota bacterium]